MTKVTLVIASLLIIALIAGVGAQQAGLSNASSTNESSNQTTQSTPGNVTDLTNAGNPLAATFQNNESLTNLAPIPSFTADIGLELIGENFTAPMMVTSPDDGTGRLFVVDQIGVAKIVDVNGTELPEPFLDLRDNLVKLDPTYDERGLLSIAFHPNYRNNGKVYVFYSAPLRPEAPEGWSCTNHISEFQVDPDNPNTVNMSSEKVLMYIDKPTRTTTAACSPSAPPTATSTYRSVTAGRQTMSGTGIPPVSGTPRISRRSTARSSGSTWTAPPPGSR